MAVIGCFLLANYHTNVFNLPICAKAGKAYYDGGKNGIEATAFV